MCQIPHVQHGVEVEIQEEAVLFHYLHLALGSIMLMQSVCTATFRHVLLYALHLDSHQTTRKTDSVIGGEREEMDKKG